LDRCEAGLKRANGLNQGLEFQICYRVILGALRQRSTGGVLSNSSLISIVDDDQAFRDSMRRLIKSLGYTVAVFPSAAEFLASPRLAVTACLVADVHMPEMTGVELYRHLIGTRQGIPTILVTAYPDDRVQERMLSEGVRCYLRKPLEEAVLIDCLHCAVARG
jgi:FixJ family two-component response regulator